MNEIVKLVRGNMRKNGMIIALAVIIAVFQVWTKGVLLKPLNITNLILQNGYILILAIGMLPVIITGRIDLSVGSIVAFIGALAAIMVVNHNVPFVITLIVCLAVGALIGAWHGFWTAYVGIPAFITTLSGILVFRGLTIAILKGRSIGPFTPVFRAISTNFIPDFFSDRSLNMTAVIIGILMCLFIIFKEIRDRNASHKAGLPLVSRWFSAARVTIICLGILALIYFLAAYEGIPYLLVLLVFLIVFYTFVTTKTVIGRRVYALGGNEAAARLSGINTKRMIFFTNINVSVLAAVAGIVFAARLNAGTPRAGNGFELDAIAACFIGGASVTGGSGTIAGANRHPYYGVMNNGMSL